jgi:hypothetical protein
LKRSHPIFKKREERNEEKTTREKKMIVRDGRDGQIARRKKR